MVSDERWLAILMAKSNLLMSVVAPAAGIITNVFAELTSLLLLVGGVPCPSMFVPYSMACCLSKNSGDGVCQ